MRKIFLIFGLLLILITGSACQSSIAANTEPPAPPLSAEPIQPKEDEVLVITAAGDIMMHDTLINAGYRRF